MIIIKRKKGDVFVNEKNVSHVIHDEENKQAIVEFRHIKGKPQVFDDVEFVACDVSINFPKQDQVR